MRGYDEKIELFLKQVHECLEQRWDRLQSGEKSDTEVDYIMENRIIAEYMKAGDISVKRYEEILKHKYGYVLKPFEITNVFKSKLGSYTDRYIFKWASEVARLFWEALSKGTPKEYKNFRNKLKNGPRNREGRRYSFLDRVAGIAIFTRNQCMNKYDDFAMLECFYNGQASSFMKEFCDILSARCGAGISTSRTKNMELTIEQSQHRIEALERELERANIRIEDLEGDIENYGREAEQNITLEFFSKFNAERYGFLLDELLSLNGKINKMRKEADLPPEITGIFITIRNLIKFVRENNLEPIMKPNSRMKVKLSDLDFCDYEGEPFADENEEKEVQIISPGWKHTALEMQISRPKVKEVLSDEN